jgi:hypothetical protein
MPGLKSEGGLRMLFDITGARDLFALLEQRFDHYCADPEKSTEDILLIIMVANHLREWIAPGFDPRRDAADSPDKKLSKQVYEHPHFNLIRQLCNGAKHLARMPPTSTEYETNVLAWRDVLAVKDVFAGVPSGHLVDGQRVEQIIGPVMHMYREWFATHS